MHVPVEHDYCSTLLGFAEVAATDYAAFLDVYTSNPYYQAFFEGDASMDLKRLQKEWQSAAEMAGHHFMGIYRLKDGAPIGIIDYLDEHPRRYLPWIGLFMIRGDLHGQGYAAEALEAFLSHMRSTAGWKRAGIGVLTANAPAMRFWGARGFQVLEHLQYPTLTGPADLAVMERRLDLV